MRGGGGKMKLGAIQQREDMRGERDCANARGNMQMALHQSLRVSRK
jgi:hypothetical protein